MSDGNSKILLNQILESGDVKVYSGDGKLISLTSDADNEQETDEVNNYLEAVERDFRENAGTILKRLELTHLQVNVTKENKKCRPETESRA